MSSFEEIFQSAVRRTQEPLCTSTDAVEAATALVQLHHSFLHRCQDPWDLAKLASSTVRCALARSGATSPCNGLLSLIVIGFHICPLPACENLSLVIKRRDYAALPSHKAPLLTAMSRCSARVGGAAVVLSLISLLHRVESLGSCAWEPFAALSLWTYDVLPILARTASGASSPNPVPKLLTTYVESWASGVLGSALRSSERAHLADEVVTLLAKLNRQPGGELLRHALTVEEGSSVVPRQWHALQSAVRERCRVDIQSYAATVSNIWATHVKPILSTAFSREPAPLSETFFRAPALSTCDARVLAGQVLVQLAEAAASRSVSELFDRCSLLASLCPEIVAHGKACSQLIRQAVTIALRTGHTSAAESFLVWGARVTEDEATRRHYADWQIRLQGIGGNGSASSEENNSRTHTQVNWSALLRHSIARCQEDRPGEAVLWPQCVQAMTEELRLEDALDTIVTSSKLVPLRVVVDACLNLPAPSRSTWPRQLLSDPFAATFLCRAVAKVCHLLLNRGDAALARAYITGLARCVVACPAQECLLLLLQALSRLGGALALDSSLGAAPNGGAAALEHWAALSAALRHLLPASPRSNFALDEVTWTQYEPMAHRCAARDSKSATTVTIGVDGEDVVLERVWHGPHERQQQNVAVLRLAKRRAALETVLTRVREVAEANRTQLQLGSDATVCPAPKVSCPATESTESCQHHIHTRSTDPNMTSPSAEEKQARKLAWWKQRFDLDHQMHEVIENLESVLGLAGVALLLGEPSEAVQAPLWQLATELAGSVASAHEDEDVSSLLHSDGFRALSYCLLQGLPYFMAMRAAADKTVNDVAITEASASSGTGKESITAPQQQQQCPRLAYQDITSVLVYPNHLQASTPYAGAEHRVSLLDRAAGALADAVEELLLFARAGTHEGCFPLPCIAAKTAAREERSSLSDSMSSLIPGTYVSAARRALQAIISAIHRKEGSTEAAVDLTQLRRQHVYLTLGNALHTLPWECVRTLRHNSCSRLPLMASSELDFRSYGDTVHSFSRVHFLVDDGATTIREHLDGMLAEHPDWSIEYCRTDIGSTAQRTHPSCASDSNAADTSTSLLTRLLKQQRTTYVYMGHRRGEAFLSARQLYSCFCAPCLCFPSLVLLLGCSSARVLGSRGFACFGMPHAYLHAGARSFVGCLWDITDGEVDRFAKRLMKLTLAAAAAGEPMTVGEAVAASRGVCKLPCLSAAATVIYGLNAVVEA